MAGIGTEQWLRGGRHKKIGHIYMTTIIKRDGTEQPFDSHKLISSIKKAGLDEETATEIAEGVAFDIRNEDSSTDDIRLMVEEDLRYYKSDALLKYGTKFS